MKSVFLLVKLRPDAVGTMREYRCKCLPCWYIYAAIWLPAQAPFRQNTWTAIFSIYLVYDTTTLTREQGTTDGVLGAIIAIIYISKSIINELCSSATK